jgi:hypothetical protein
VKTRYQLSYIQRQVVDLLKEDGNVFVNAPRAGRKSFCAAVAVSEMASEMGGIFVRDALTGIEYFVPPGTPWQEALPVREQEES